MSKAAAWIPDTPDWSLYPYSPNKELPIIFAIIVFALGVLLAVQSFLIRPRWVHFGSLMTWAASIWVAGFVVRAISVWTIENQQNVALYVVQYIFILMGPSLFAVAEVFILSRLLAYLPYHSPVNPTRVIPGFIFLSTVVESLIGAGAGISSSPSNSASNRQTGVGLAGAGLVLQCLIEVLFMSIVAAFQLRTARAGHNTRRIVTVCAVLYVTSAMMLVRCVIRAAQAFEELGCNNHFGMCGTIAENEWFEWVFEVGNITLFIVLLAVFYPRKYVPAGVNVFLDPIDGKTERLGPGFSRGSRFWIVTITRPFDIPDRFWERSWPAVDEAEAFAKKQGSGSESSARAADMA